MIPAPEKSVKQIAWETMEEPVVRTTNRYWTELTAAMLAGHFLGNKFGYIKLIAVAAAGLGLNIFLKIILEVVQDAQRTS